MLSTLGEEVVARGTKTRRQTPWALGGASPELPMRLRRLSQSLSTVGGLTNHALVKGEALKAKGGVVSATSEPPWQVSKSL